MLNKALCCILAGLGLLTGCSKPASTQPAPATPTATNSTANSGSLATAPVDYLNTLGKTERSTIKSVDVSVLSDAIRRFQVEVGRYPNDLNELVTEKYVPRIPPVPYGSKLDYDPSTGEVKVISAQ